MNPRPAVAFSPYTIYSRDEWAALRADTPNPLSEAELENLSGLTERVSTQEVVEIYLPLSRLLNFYVEALQELHGATTGFLRKGDSKMPFIIGLAGSVAVGKSTTGRVLQALLARWPSHPSVELVPTDGFLFANAVLEERGLMGRKGFPESYDLTALLNFLALYCWPCHGGERFDWLRLLLSECLLDDDHHRVNSRFGLNFFILEAGHEGHRVLN